MASVSTSNLVDLETGEHIILEVRRHMIVFYARVLFLVVLFFVPLFLSPFVTILIDKAVGAAIGAVVFGFLFSLWLLAMWITFFLQWTDYYLDVWVITNKRIFNINQKGLFTREITVYALEKVQDITIEVKGVLATFLKYGTIRIETASESTNFAIENATNPVEVKNTIMRAHSALLGSSQTMATEL